MLISDWSSDVFSSDLKAVQGVLDLVVFNALIGNADAHAKNLSLLCDQGGRRWLAPLYDLVPTIHLPESLVERTPAMRIGQAARIDRIGVDDWADFAEAAGYRKAYVLERVQSLSSAERRVGKECVRTCRSRWAADH